MKIHEDPIVVYLDTGNPVKFWNTDVDQICIDRILCSLNAL